MAAEVLLSPSTTCPRKQHLFLGGTDHSRVIKVPLGKGMERLLALHRGSVEQPRTTQT